MQQVKFDADIGRIDIVKGASKNLRARFHLMPFGSENRRKPAKYDSIPLVYGDFPPLKSAGALWAAGF
ncbi:MAG TPA: hypothetical protein DCO86_05080 [Spirochaetaceae bacterium]|nr:hypothetical protein [Spirochaetaceae bacterium]